MKPNKLLLSILIGISNLGILQPSFAGSSNVNVNEASLCQELKDNKITKTDSAEFALIVWVCQNKATKADKENLLKSQKWNSETIKYFDYWNKVFGDKFETLPIDERKFFNELKEMFVAELNYNSRENSERAPISLDHALEKLLLSKNGKIPSKEVLKFIIDYKCFLTRKGVCERISDALGSLIGRGDEDIDQSALIEGLDAAFLELLIEKPAEFVTRLYETSLAPSKGPCTCSRLFGSLKRNDLRALGTILEANAKQGDTKTINKAREAISKIILEIESSTLPQKDKDARLAMINDLDRSLLFFMPEIVIKSQSDKHIKK